MKTGEPVGAVGEEQPCNIELPGNAWLLAGIAEMTG